jgi:hypothetical protein
VTRFFSPSSADSTLRVIATPKAGAAPEDEEDRANVTVIFGALQNDPSIKRAALMDVIIASK